MAHQNNGRDANLPYNDMIIYVRECMCAWV